jgi:hypothetical protein
LAPTTAMRPPTGEESPEAPPTQITADQDKAATQTPTPPRTHTQATPTQDSATATQGTSTLDFVTQISPPHASSI